MPISTPDAVSFRALIPTAVSTIVLDDGSALALRLGKIGYPAIVDVALRSPVVGPLLTAVIDAVVSGAAKDKDAILAAIQGAVAKAGMDLGTFVQRFVSDAPDAVFELLTLSASKHLTFAPGESVEDFIAFLRQLGPDAHVTLMKDWLALNLPGGAGPFVAALTRIMPAKGAAAGQAAQTPAPSADTPASGTPSTMPPTNSAEPATTTAG